MTNRRSTRARGRSEDTVDLRGVEAGGGRRSAHLPEEEGPFTFVIDQVSRKEGKDSGKAYLDLRCKVYSGRYKGKVVWHNCSLQPQALFNLRQVMEACGLDAEKVFRIPVLIRTLTGKRFKAEVEDDEYNGKVKSVLSEFIIDQPDGDEDEDEDGEEEDEEEDEDDEEDEEEDEDEEPPARARRRAPARAPARAAAPSRNGTRAAPARTRAAAAAPARSSRRRAPADDDDEDLDEIDLEDL